MPPFHMSVFKKYMLILNLRLERRLWLQVYNKSDHILKVKTFEMQSIPLLFGKENMVSQDLKNKFHAYVMLRTVFHFQLILKELSPRKDNRIAEFFLNWTLHFYTHAVMPTTELCWTVFNAALHEGPKNTADSWWFAYQEYLQYGILRMF